MKPPSIIYENVKGTITPDEVVVKIKQGGGILYARHRKKETNKIVWRALFHGPDGTYKKILAPVTFQNREFKSLDTLFNFHERIFNSPDLISLPFKFDDWSIEHKLDCEPEE